MCRPLWVMRDMCFLSQPWVARNSRCRRRDAPSCTTTATRSTSRQRRIECVWLSKMKMHGLKLIRSSESEAVRRYMPLSRWSNPIALGLSDNCCQRYSRKQWDIYQPNLRATAVDHYTRDGHQHRSLVYTARTQSSSHRSEAPNSAAVRRKQQDPLAFTAQFFSSNLYYEETSTIKGLTALFLG